MVSAAELSLVVSEAVIETECAQVALKTEDLRVTSMKADGPLEM